MVIDYSRQECRVCRKAGLRQQTGAAVDVGPSSGRVPGSVILVAGMTPVSAVDYCPGSVVVAPRRAATELGRTAVRRWW